MGHFGDNFYTPDDQNNSVVVVVIVVVVVVIVLLVQRINVPLNTLEVISGTIFTGQMTKTTVL